MSEVEQQVKRRPDGTFAEAPPWLAPRWRKGQSGHTARYKQPNQVISKLNEYLTYCHTEEKKPTWSGLARHMGITTDALNRYRKGEVESAHPSIVDVLQYAQTCMEAFYEEILTSKEHSTAGVVFWLKNRSGWRDEKHLAVETQDNQTLTVILPPVLMDKMKDVGDSMTVIEGVAHDTTSPGDND